MSDQVTPSLEFSEDDLSVVTPTYVDISDDLIEATWGDGKTRDLDEPQAGGATFVLKNTRRRFEPQYVAGDFYPNIVPLRRFRLRVDTDDRQGIEFWGDFEQGADGTASEWTSGNGAIECKAGAEARQLQYVTSPTPRLGAKAMRFEVASGDQFGASTGERALVRRGRQNAAWPVAVPEGQTAYYQFSFRCLGAWTHPTGWEIFQQFKSDARYGQPIMRLQVNDARTNFMLSLDTGEFPNATDATNGVNAGTNLDFTGPAFAADVWWDVRYIVRWTTAKAGYVEWWMKPSSESTWLNAYRYAQVAGIATLPTTVGDSTIPTLEEFVGFYRNASAFTNVVFHDGYQVGHSWTDVDYPTTTPSDPAFNQVTWNRKDNILDLQGGNPGGSFENSTVGVTNTGGGITSSSSTDRSKFGSYSLKVVTDGSGGSQGVRHFKSGGATRFDVTAGSTYTASCWVSSAADFSTWRIGIEFFDAGAVSLGTTQCLSRGLRNDWRRFWVTVVAPVGAVTARIENRWAGTTAGTFYVDGLGFWEGTYAETFDEGIWYATSYEVVYPDKRAPYSEVVVNCVDGFGLLSLDALDMLDPAEATSYPEVVNFDAPSFYYRLGEPEGTKLVSHARTKKFRRQYPHAPGKFKTRETRAEVEGEAGPSGTYVGLPTPGAAGLILGDTDTCVQLDGVNDYLRVPVDQENTIDGNVLTIEAWVNPTSLASEVIVASGPYITAPAGPAWFMSIKTTGALRLQIQFTDTSFLNLEGGTVTASTTAHCVATWSGTTAVLYVNGAEVARTTNAGQMRTGDAAEFLRFGVAKVTGVLTNFFTGRLDEIAIYEKDLSPSRVLAHYNAGANRGFATALTGSRITSVVTSALWSEAKIQSGSFNVQPVMEVGQPKLNEILETVRAEMPDNHFIFDGYGDPVYLGWNYKDAYPYNTIQSTLGDASTEVKYADLALVYDDDLYNQVTTSADGGVAQTATDSASVSGFKPRQFTETNLLLSNDADAMSVSNAILSTHSQPQFRLTSVSLNGAAADRRNAILGRQIGDLIRVKRREGGGTPIDIVTTILGKTKRIDQNRHLSCTWTTSRGFNAAAGYWRAGISGFSEAESTTFAAP